MGLKVKPWVLLRRQVLMAGAAVALTRSAAPAAATVAFIGDGPADRFEPWRKFREALQTGAPHLLAPSVLTYVACPKDQAAKRAAIAASARQHPTVLVAPTGNSARMAVAEAGGCAVVFASFLDPVRAGFAQDDRMPGGRATGISLADWLDAKRLEALRDAFPGMRRVGVLTDLSWAEHYQGEARMRQDAESLGLDATLYYGSSTEDIDRLMKLPHAAQEDAWYVLPTHLAYMGEARIAAHLARLRAPGMFSTLGEVQRGGALAYVADTSFVYPKLAELVARVLAGEDPGGIPIERPRRFLLAARADARWREGPISTRLLRRADRIV